MTQTKPKSGSDAKAIAKRAKSPSRPKPTTPGLDPGFDPVSRREVMEKNVGSWLVRSAILLVIVLCIGYAQGKRPSFRWIGGDQVSELRGARLPLVMQGGDPHIRALMRTISASESNYRNPYAILYGGAYADDLSHHPNRCITIVRGPNTGNCTTAAGRYQFLSSTWAERSQRYHPAPSGVLFWQQYSFEPEYQDQVLYGWLLDEQAWGMDIRQKLRNGEIKTVLQRLSDTWTSLGYGIESHSMSAELPAIYQQVLREELQQASKLPSKQEFVLPDISKRSAT